MRRICLILPFCLVLVCTFLAHAQTFTTLANFDGSNGYTPSGPLIQAGDGKLYGLTAQGGTFGLGILYQFTLPGTLRVGPSFSTGWDGYGPSGRLLEVVSWDEAFVGAIGNGSAASLFQLGMGGLEGSGDLCSGCQPKAGLVRGSDGLFYGTAASGGTGACSDGCGFVFKTYGVYSPQTLHQFKDTDGANPRGELLQAKDGNFYGTTVNGGKDNCQDGCGTIFKITPSGTFTSLYKFCSQSNCADGANPYGALVQGADGNLYGTTSSGGNVGVNCPLMGCGTIFKITLQGTLTTLYSFCAEFFCPTGANPQSGVIQASDGNFYGTTSSGGDSTLGTLFRITPQGKLSLLHNFTGNEGAYPSSALLQASDKKFYGTTPQGGTGDGGTIFRMEIDFNATLSVTKSGNGKVASDDNKIQCGSTCSAKYESGDVIELTATPDQQWGFAGWTGCDRVQTNVCTVTMNHARGVAVTFSPVYPLSVSKAGDGTISSNDGFIDCGQTCSHTYLVWSSVVLTAAPSQGWVLTGWNGCDWSDGYVCSVTINNARNASATFKPLYPLTVSNSGNGLVIANGGIYCGAICSVSYADGSKVTLTGLPNPGYTVGWSGCDNMQGNVCTVTVSAARNVTASFMQNQVTLTSLVVSPPTVKGGNLSSGKVTLSKAAPPGGVGIAISNDHPEAAHPPLQVVVPGGQSSVSFAIQTFVVHARVVANLTASAGSSHVNATLTVMPPNWRGQSLASNGPDVDEPVAEPDLEARLVSAGGRSPSPGDGIHSPHATAVLPPPADPADEQKEYPVEFIGAVPPVGEYNGDLRDLPQIRPPQPPERELVSPVDRVHQVFPAVPPPDTLMASVGPMPRLFKNFPGLSLLQDGGAYPPDTTGAVGMRYYVQAINRTFAVFDKISGTRIYSFDEWSLWLHKWNSVCATSPVGDPVVLYDQKSDRWILTNIAFQTDTPGPYYECVAVSKSGDPVRGGWILYELRTDQNPVPAHTLNDYPKFGLWNDGCLYMGADGFLDDSYNGQVILSLSLSDMYSGKPLRYSLSFLSGSANFALFPATMLGKGNNLPPPSEKEYFVQESQTSDAFNVRTISPGSCTSGGTLGAVVAVPHQTYNAFDYDIVPQPPPATKDNYLDSLSNVMMQWVQYRKVDAKESLWVNHTTYVTGANTSPQWAQIDVTGGKINTKLVQQQIYRPDSSLFRWLGSLAVDSFGGMALCYSTSNAQSPNYPSINCAGRLANDPPGQLPQGETRYFAGHGSQVFDCSDGSCHRWGDYSSTTIDPVDDCTFWHTNMFYDSPDDGSQGFYKTQIIAFRYPNCVTPAAKLTVKKSGSGVVTSSDGFIDCGSTCSHEYEAYDRINMTATATPGWLFSGWAGCDESVNDSCSITLFADRTATASFTQGKFTLYVSDIGTGTGKITSSDGFINCGSKCSHEYPGGTALTLTATPEQGSRFDGWSGCHNIQNNVCTVDVTENTQMSATFNTRTEHYRLSVEKWGSGVGDITSSDGHINCGPACSYDYNPSDNVTLTAQVEHGSVLQGWVGCDQVQGGECYVKMGEIRNVTAKINIATYVLSVVKGGSGTISSTDGHIQCGTTCSYSYAAWSNVVLNAAPGQGWVVTGWTGCDQADGNACSVSMNDARNVSVTFNVVYSLVVSKAGSGLVIGNGGIYCGSTCSASYPDGSDVYLTGIPDPGYTMAWSGCDETRGNLCTVGMSGGRNVGATFTRDQMTLTSVSFNPSYIKGGQLSAGTLTLNAPAPPGGVTVALSSDHPGVAHPPSFVFVPGGKSSVGFAVNTFPVKSNTKVSITATAGASHVSGTLMVGRTALPPSLH